MYLVEDATSDMSVIYFIIVIFVGGLFLINMIIAVVYSVFADKRKELNMLKYYERQFASKDFV